ncbi:471_t:CDS:1, partial [Ambispora gerdemannii]
CKITTETNEHIWTCNQSTQICNNIFDKFPNKLANAILKHITLDPNDITQQCKNFCYNAKFLNQPHYNSVAIGRKPDYINAFNGFVPEKLVTFIRQHTLSYQTATNTAAQLIHWISLKGYKKIWITCCKIQITQEKQLHIYAKDKKNPSNRIHPTKSLHITTLLSKEKNSTLYSKNILILISAYATKPHKNTCSLNVPSKSDIYL